VASVFADIRNALEGNLSNVAGIPATPSIGAANAFDGARFEPTAGQTWLRVSYSPSSRVPLDVNAAGLQRYLGLLLVDVFAPYGTGAKAAEDLADAVISAYEAGTTLTSNGVTVEVVRAEVNFGPSSEPPWITVPVSIRWKAFYD